MADYQITHKRHDKNEVITHVAFGGGIYPLVEAIRRYDSGDRFHTYGGGKLARVHKVVHPSGHPYLSTNPDGILPNNLDNLPNC